MVVSELAKMAPETSWVAFTQASLTSLIPASILENIFSNTTKELSRTIPTAKLMPARLMRLIVLPKMSKTIKELIILVGIATEIIRAVLRDFKNKSKIMIARIAPNIKFCFTKLIDELI